MNNLSLSESYIVVLVGNIGKFLGLDLAGQSFKVPLTSRVIDQEFFFTSAEVTFLSALVQLFVT